jgi:hypothetical protein
MDMIRWSVLTLFIEMGIHKQTHVEDQTSSNLLIYYGAVWTHCFGVYIYI